MQTERRDTESKLTAAYLLRKKSHLALVHVFVALVEVILDAVPIVDLDVVADLRDRRPDGLKRSILCRLHHTHLQDQVQGRLAYGL